MIMYKKSCYTNTEIPVVMIISVKKYMGNSIKYFLMYYYDFICSYKSFMFTMTSEKCSTLVPTIFLSLLVEI